MLLTVVAKLPQNEELNSMVNQIVPRIPPQRPAPPSAAALSAVSPTGAAAMPPLLARCMTAYTLAPEMFFFCRRSMRPYWNCTDDSYLLSVCFTITSV